jgi:hypothetical protein
MAPNNCIAALDVAILADVQVAWGHESKRGSGSHSHDLHRPPIPKDPGLPRHLHREQGPADHGVCVAKQNPDIPAVSPPGLVLLGVTLVAAMYITLRRTRLGLGAT